MNEGLHWTDWPAARSPGRAVFAAVVVVLFAGAIVTVDRLLGLVGTFLLLGSVADSLFPTRFSLDGDGVRARNLLRSANRPWSRLGAWRAVPGGFTVTGRSPSKLLRRLRGVELRCPGHEAEVETLLRQHLGAPAGDAGAREETTDG
ncbi:MAG: hypothetical protein KDA24_21280 [Deltaproteobacteria bacterium]|nr:hypothetical protein [Deltaproteobacteria bacterium]